MKYITFEQKAFTSAKSLVLTSNKALESAIDSYLVMALSHALSTGKADKVCDAVNAFANSGKRSLTALSSQVKDYLLAHCEHLKAADKTAAERFPLQVKKGVKPESFNEDSAKETMLSIVPFSRWKKEKTEPKKPSFDILSRFNGFTKQVNKFLSENGLQDQHLQAILERASNEIQAHLELTRQQGLASLKEANPEKTEEEIIKGLTNPLPHYLTNTLVFTDEVKTGTNN